MTVREIIEAAYRKCSGLLAEGEAPSAEMMQDGLEALNMMLDSWSAERLAVFTTQDQTLTWPAGERVQTIGPSGDLTALRPITVDDSTYFVYAGISYELHQINESQYNSIALKTSTSTYPQVYWVEMGMPNITMTVFPVPTVDIELHLISVQALSQFTGLSQTVSFPPGYQRALVFNLASEIAPEHGLEPTPTVQRIAMTAKRNLKRINSPKDVMSVSTALPGLPNRYNIYAGDY